MRRPPPHRRTPVVTIAATAAIGVALLLAAAPAEVGSARPAASTPRPGKPSTTKPATTTTVRPRKPTTTQAATTTTVRTTTTQAATTTTRPATTTTRPATTTTRPATTTTRPATTTSTPGGGGRFLLDFSSPSQVAQLDRVVYHRNLSVGYPGGHDFHGTWSGDHDMSCAGPTTQRTVHASADGTDPEAFWYCAPAGPDSGHFMTSMGDIDGYSVVAFAPARTFSNFSRVCWDVNLTDLMARKWFEVHIISEAAYQGKARNKLIYVNPDFAGVDGSQPYPADSINLDFFGHQIKLWTGQDQQVWDQVGFFTNDKARRYHHCFIDNGNGTITFTQERDSGTRSQTFRGRFPAQGRVIFSDHSYTPTKDGMPRGFTWHWDNLEVS